MSQGFELKWYAENVTLLVGKAEDAVLDKAALQTLAHAQVNIQQNDQIDTGFMLNSGYVVSAESDTYNDARSEARAQADREMAPKADLEEGDALVAFGAEYSIYQEASNSFLYRALESVRNEMRGIIKAAGLSVGLR